jgi:hypothetical protein
MRNTPFLTIFGSRPIAKTWIYSGFFRWRTRKDSNLEPAPATGGLGPCDGPNGTTGGSRLVCELPECANRKPGR